MKLLICVASPRDIPAFTTCINTIPHDKIWVKYTGYEHDPNGQLVQFFLDHPEYTHMARCPDDLMVHKKGVETLIEDSKTYDIISGIFNVSYNDFECPWRTSWTAGCTKNLPPMKFPRNYDWYTIGEIRKLGRFVPVPFSGKAFCIMPRHLVAKFSWTGDKAVRPQEGKPSAYDLGISHELKEMDLQEYVDTFVFFAHFRYGGKLMNRIKPEQLWYERAGEERQILKPIERTPFSGKIN